jgi:hypothetical protein
MPEARKYMPDKPRKKTPKKLNIEEFLTQYQVSSDKIAMMADDTIQQVRKKREIRL